MVGGARSVKCVEETDIGLTHPLEPIVERLMEKTKGSFIKFTKKELFEMLGEDDGKKKT